jgi:hypothetical protein
LKNPLYCLAVKIDTGLLYDPDFNKNVLEFARTFGMEIKDLKGNAEIAEQSYLAAKRDIFKNSRVRL